MKTCPACGTQYEDHVPQCFVDGTSLDDIPVEATSRFDAGTSSAPNRDAAPVSTSEPPPQPARNSMPVLVALVGIGFLLVAAIAVLMLFLFAAPGADPVPPQTVPQPAPIEQPVPLPPPEPPPPAPVVLSVGITSTPPGAGVWEGAAELCVTPCSIDHPEHAPLPRFLVLKADDHVDTPYELGDPGRPHHVTLAEVPRVVRPGPRPQRPTPSPAPPSPGPRPAPAPAIELER